MFALLEMRVGKTEEDFTELVFLKKVGEEFHRVGADAGCVLVGICRFVLDAEGADVFLHVFCYRGANLHACAKFVNFFPIIISYMCRVFCWLFPCFATGFFFSFDYGSCAGM